MVILKESKRDDLLLPYLEILHSKGINMSLGMFKTVMLDKLSNQGGMHNLSLGSNFYLAGATKYYFNGDLTLNKDLSILKGDENATDQWNEEVCKRLDACIVILRNAFIDTVGTTFEQPEDFGNLSIAKLLRKYNKKINAELGIVTEPRTRANAKQKTDDNPNVGNGYTFKILYNYHDGTCFERLTAPGSWCITYGQNHYRYYMRHLNIHYVIFLKNGYENVERRVGPGFTKRKPHDEYGNSMIALLQSNEDGSPVYITSRWNHGHYSDDTNGTEADHAYTPEEFYRITGVTPEDLQRIFHVWEENKGKRNPNSNSSASEAKKEKLQALRYLKYAQYRANGGDSLWNYITASKFLAGSVNPATVPESDRPKVWNKSIMAGKIPSDDETLQKFSFIVDRGQISFDSVVPEREWAFQMAHERYTNTRNEEDNGQLNKSVGKMHDIVIITLEDNQGRESYMLYDTRRRCLVSVSGTVKFKAIPRAYDGCYGTQANPMFYTVAVRTYQRALIRVSNNQPLVLPNGECWFQQVKDMNHQYGPGGVDAEYIGTVGQSMIEIIYDQDANTRFFYSLAKKDFIKIPDSNEVFSDGDTCGCNVGDIPVLNTQFWSDKYYSIQYNNRGYYDNWGRWATVIFDKNTNQPVDVAGFKAFAMISVVDGASNYARVKLNQEGLRQYVVKSGARTRPNISLDRNEFGTVDLGTNKMLTLNGCVLLSSYVNNITLPNNQPGLDFTIHDGQSYAGNAHIFYRLSDKSFFINPQPIDFTGYDKEYMFFVYRFNSYNPINDMWVYARPPHGYLSIPWNADLNDYPRDFKRIKLENCQTVQEVTPGDVQQQQRVLGAPAFSISESDIKSMVVNALKLITENGKGERRR